MRLKPLFTCGVIVCLGAGFAPAVQETDTDQLDLVAGATVFIRVQRIFIGKTMVSGGTGFFVHPEGYILTDLLVVDEPVEDPRFSDYGEVHAKPIAIHAVVTEPGRRARAVPCEVVATDRTNRLALLKVREKPRDLVALGESIGVEASDPLAFVGYSAAGLMEGGTPADVSEPRITVLSGRVAAVEYDEEGTATQIRTDTVMDVGHCGAPILNADDKVVAVAVCARRDHARRGDGVPLDLAGAFLADHLIRVSVEPGVVLDPTLPVTVTVAPSAPLAFTELWIGTVRVSTDDATSVASDLRRDSDGWRGTIAVPQAADPYAQLRLTVLLHDAGGRERYRRVRSVDIVRGSPAALPHRPFNPQHDEAPTPVPSATSQDTTLSQLASGVRLEGGDGGVVIDNTAVEDVTAGMAPLPALSDELYSALPGNPTVRALARDFDQSLLQIEALELEIKLLEKERSIGSYERRRRFSQRVQVRREDLKRIRKISKSLATDLVSRGICRCEDRRWYLCNGAPCASPIPPHVE